MDSPFSSTVSRPPRIMGYVGNRSPPPPLRSSALTLHLCPQIHDSRFEVRGRHGKSVLTIGGVRLGDLGRFDCEALSRIGGHQKSMFLDIECEYC